MNVSILAALGLAAPLAALNVRELGRTRPILKNSKRALRQLDSAFDKRVDELKPGAQVAYDLGLVTPKPGLEGTLDVLKNSGHYAGSSQANKPPGININPNADRAYLAHEMGHLASQQTDVGHFVASMRANPKLKTALTGALLTVPGIAAALESGDDDMDTSLALAALSQAPTLVDEALATKNGLAIMDKAGMRANLGQRGKLAGGLLSYLAAPMLVGAAANKVGNIFDEDPMTPDNSQATI